PAWWASRDGARRRSSADRARSSAIVASRSRGATSTERGRRAVEVGGGWWRLTPYLNPSERCKRHDPRHSRRLDRPPPGSRSTAHPLADAPAGHAAPAGRGRAGVAALSPRLGAAPPDAAVSRGHVGLADVGIQRGPRVLVARVS